MKHLQTALKCGLRVNDLFSHNSHAVYRFFSLPPSVSTLHIHPRPPPTGPPVCSPCCGRREEVGHANRASLFAFPPFKWPVSSREAKYLLFLHCILCVFSLRYSKAGSEDPPDERIKSSSDGVFFVTISPRFIRR